MSDGQLWVVVTVAAAAAQTLRNATQKSLTAEIGTWGATLVRFLFGLPFAFVFLGTVAAAEGRAPPVPGAAALVWITLGAAAQVLATASMLQAMRRRSFVVTTAFTKTEPVQVLVFASLFLGEVPPPLVVVGVVSATWGVATLAWPPPPASLARTDTTMPALFGLGAGALFALSAVGYKGGIAALAPVPGMLEASTALVLALALQAVVMTALMARLQPAALAGAARRWRASWLAGFTGALASQLWFLAFALQDVAAVRTVALVELLFAQLVARRLFRETPTIAELVGVGLLVGGVALVLWGSA